MAAAQWMEIYRSYTGDELTQEIADLKADLKGAYASQSSGSISHQRNIGELRDRLQAATRVINERAGAHDPSKRVGQADFSETSVDQF
jgi:hypothetical protein